MKAWICLKFKYGRQMVRHFANQNIYLCHVVTPEKKENTDFNKVLTHTFCINWLLALAQVTCVSI